jgi:hypothetical protein
MEIHCETILPPARLNKFSKSKRTNFEACEFQAALLFLADLVECNRSINIDDIAGKANSISLRNDNRFVFGIKRSMLTSDAASNAAG